MKRLIAVVACLACPAISGCATWKLYPGPDRPPSEVAAIIRSRGPNSALTVENIDGLAPGGPLTYRYEVPPGRHSVKVSLDALNSGTAHLFAQAGHRYLLRVEINSATDTWRPWLEDVGAPKGSAPEVVPDAVNSRCAAGESEACVTLADALHRGVTPEGWDEARASRLYQAACEAGYLPGCTGLGDMYESGHGVDKDPEQAARLFDHACPGDPKACNLRGVLNQSGELGPPDLSIVATWYQKACDRGYAAGCYNLAQLYRNAHLWEKPPLPPLYEKACKGGEPAGCYQLARLYQEGAVAGEGGASAVALLDQACAAGEPQACNGLGQLYEQGGLVDQDERRAAGLYQRACAAGGPEGCSNYGALLALGLGVERDDAKAFAALRVACEGGVETACGGASILELEMRASKQGDRQ
jgi:TPR repeat protein